MLETEAKEPARTAETSSSAKPFLAFEVETWHPA